MFKKRLKKVDMVNYYKYEKKLVYSSKKEFIKLLNQIEEEFYTHKFVSDKRYSCIGRQRFLIDEMEELYYSKEECEKRFGNHYTCPTIWCLDSLIELMVNPNFVSSAEYDELININSMYADKSKLECRKLYDQYLAEEIICLEERDYIMHALNMIKDSLKKCDNMMKWLWYFNR